MSHHPAPPPPLNRDDLTSPLDLVGALRAAARQLGFVLPEKYDVRRAETAAGELLAAIGATGDLVPQQTCQTCHRRIVRSGNGWCHVEYVDDHPARGGAA